METNIMAIDLGTSRTRIVAAVTDDKRPYALSIVHAETQTSQGIKRGAVYNKEDVLKVVRNLVTGAEKKFSSGAKRKASNAAAPAQRIVCVNVGGTCFQTSIINEKINIQGQNVSRRTLQYIENQAENNQTQFSLEESKVFRLVSLGYSIDNEPLNNDVLGRSGNIFEAKFLCFKAKQKDLSLINSAFPAAPNKPSTYYTSTSAKAVVALSPSLKRDGVALIDLGSGTTGVAVFYRDALRLEVEIPIGSATITSDIASALNIPFADAEALKCSLGIIDEAQSHKEYAFDLGNGEQASFNGSFYNFVVKARLEEIAAYVASVLTDVRKAGNRDIKLVLTGGGSLLKNAESVFADKVEAEVVAIPLPDLDIDPIEYAAAIGMASLTARKQMEVVTDPVLPIAEPEPAEPQGPAEQEPETNPQPAPPQNHPNNQRGGSKIGDLFSRWGKKASSLFDDENNVKN